MQGRRKVTKSVGGGGKLDQMGGGANWMKSRWVEIGLKWCFYFKFRGKSVGGAKILCPPPPHF